MKKLCAWAAGLLLLYLAAYVALLKPVDAIEGNLGRLARFKVPAYRVDGAWTIAFFRPLNRLDQDIRGPYWAEQVVPDSPVGTDRIEEVAVPNPVDPDTPLPN